MGPKRLQVQEESLRTRNLVIGMKLLRKVLLQIIEYVECGIQNT